MNTKNQKDNKKSTGQTKNKSAEKNKTTDNNKTGPSKKKIKKHFFKHKKKARKSEKPEKPSKNNAKQSKNNNTKQRKNKSQNRKKPPNKKPKEKENNKLEVGKAINDTEWNIESISRYIIAVKAAVEKTPETQDGKKDLLEVWINSSLPVDLIYQIIDQYPDDLNIDKKKFMKDNKPLF